MSFQPVHPQPFTPAEAAQLDVGTIVAEIARLRNSLSHLIATQGELRSALAEEEDADLRSALDENEGVIASQSERVEMLRSVLIDKVGAESLAHYGIEPPPTQSPAQTNGSVANGAPTASEDEGMHL
ncbi:hypothetical protein CC85DRAFT_284563 [Cutaneotrichosporon oleaginosum]|uniref:Uncharacterized protein n=1 Tax=Cutaneotrichosporon oleaginosum TaxID=879819 RepID=A0A0J0XQR2_9TREE|nr:uncharacterized protein CC85DRAFT_284563 [Cutaneotrichosporon oleaginosum]KLT43418.1 hypothetical protein CC85DRAFT_284563 [Cutaneotrichosporon oleaginosum]TXT05368.1 hypothetical protein COLE_06688 [Cutaneotrichosporon oleaginosum]